MHEDAWQHINNCLHCKNPQCVKGCPVKFDIPSFLQQAKQGDFDAAVQTVGHLFGEVCGYICPKHAQCRGNCILSPKGKGVDVGLVEILAFGKAKIQIERCDDALSHLNIAVVGGGVSGIVLHARGKGNGVRKAPTVAHVAEYSHFPFAESGCGQGGKRSFAKRNTCRTV